MSEITTKAMGQFKMRAGALLHETFGRYGQDIHVTPAVEALTELAYEMHSLLLLDETPRIVQGAREELKREIMAEFDKIAQENNTKEELEEIQPD